jgi:hypothetical protein
MTRSAGTRLANSFLWSAPIFVCFWLHWYGLKAWFWSDDFAWLGLHNLVFDGSTLLHQLFTPLAQGTIRPWSERGFFLLFYRLFGLDALPYHAWVFATQAANLLLLAWIVRKLSGSLLCGSFAGILWSANSALVEPMAWTSDYNQILCSFFLLAAFALYLADRYWLQFIVFVLGFGALEINVVYPAILLAWLLLNRKSVKPAIPLFAVSVVYYWAHRIAAPAQASGPYTLHFDASMLRTLSTYWQWMGAPESWLSISGHSPKMALAATALLAAAVGYLVVRGWKRNDRNPAFFLCWFLIALAPVLPLREHVTTYYLAIPSLGIATILALGFQSATLLSLAIPAFAAALYLFMQVPATRFASRWHFERSIEVRSLVRGVIRAHEIHPGQAILLTGVSEYLYATSLAHSPFYVVGFEQVYLAPETNFKGYANLVPASEHILPAGATLRALSEDKIQVYQAGGYRLKNVTSAYARQAFQNLSENYPSRLDLGDPLMGYLLGSTWYPLEGSHRWMPKVASIRIAGPRKSDAKLVITGYCPQEQARLGPLKLHISIDGKKFSEAEFSKQELPFFRSFDLPADFARKESMELVFEVSRTFQGGPGDRPLGLAFGVVEIR